MASVSSWFPFQAPRLLKNDDRAAARLGIPRERGKQSLVYTSLSRTVWLSPYLAGAIGRGNRE